MPDAVTLDWLKSQYGQLTLLFKSSADRVACAADDAIQATQRVEKAADLASNGSMGPARCIDCLRALAPLQDIQDCLAGGGYVEVLWGVEKNIAAAARLRVMACEANKATTRAITQINGATWAEGKDVALSNPAKYILRIKLIPRFGA